MCFWDKRRVCQLAVVAVATLLIAAAVAPSSQAQNPVDPGQSWVESHCDFVILSAPWGEVDDIGDRGIVVHCYDGDGLPVEGLPGTVFRLVRLDDIGSWEVVADATDEAGRTILHGPALEDAVVVHGQVGVEVDIGGEVVLLDNGGGGVEFEMRTPDFNGDDVVNLVDAVAFAAAYGCCEDTEDCLKCDFDGDGCVGLTDFAIFGEYLGGGGKAGVHPRMASPPMPRQDEELFLGCIQHDFGSDTDPETLTEEIIALPFEPFHLRFVARGFRELTGADFAIGVPPELYLLTRVPVPEFPVEIPGYAEPGDERVIVSGNCVTDSPVFVFEFQFMSTTGGYYNSDSFPIRHVAFANCSYPPIASEACVGSPTPCEVSYVEPGMPVFISCPGGDLDTDDIVTAVMKDQDGNGVPGLAADDFRVVLEDERGSDRAYMVRMTPLAAATDNDGQLPFRFELRESCRWDTCLDLVVTFQYEACKLVARKKVRTINGVPAVSEGVQADGIIDLTDLGWWSAQQFMVDDCLTLVHSFRCPLVTNQEIALIADHMGHSCEVTAGPVYLAPATLVIHQNEPNPFNPLTNLRVHLPRAAHFATLMVYDVQGRLVDTIWTGALPQGPSVFTWDGRDAAGRAVASGAYIARFSALGEDAAVRMLLLR